MHHVIILIVNK